MHVNSLLAYYENLYKFNRREKEILGDMVMCGNQARTDRQIKDSLRFSDMNAVRPRISDLIDMRVVEECGNTKCVLTGKRVRLVRIRESGERQMRFNFAG